MIDKEDFLKKYASHLNEKQLEAVQQVNGPVLLLAVPGSGKTTVLVNRLGYMLYCEGIAPENILTLTYTIAATQDMAGRFETLFGADFSGRLEFRTINGICAKVIAEYGKMIGRTPFELVKDEKITGKILTDILAKNMNEYPTESDVKGARTLITYCKNMLLAEDEIAELGEQAGLNLWEVYSQYNDYLKQNRLMDYDDQMVYALRMLKGSPELLDRYKRKYRYICVDEAQDTSKIQHCIIGLLAGRDGNLFMVGDEDQSIYGFRAAYPDALLNFEADHPGAKVLVMDKNYRSNAKIVSGADAFIQHNESRHEKHMVATRDGSSDIKYIELKGRANQYGYLVKVADGCTRETAVLYRDNESAVPLIDLLDRQNIPFRIKSIDMGFFTHRIVTDVTNIMRFAISPRDTDLFMRIYFKCQTYLKKTQAERLCQISAEKGIPVLDALDYLTDLNGKVIGQCRSFQTHLRKMTEESTMKALYRIETPLGYGEYIERNGMDENKLFILKQLAYNEKTVPGFLDRLEYLQEKLKNGRTDYDSRFILSTIHSSKGLEYDRVYMMDVCDGVFPVNVVRSKKAASEQELKLFEEERRLFYVGMTRAKNDLNIFTLSDGTSCFVREISDSRAKKASGKGKSSECGAEENIKKKGQKTSSKTYGSYQKESVSYGRKKFVSSYNLMIGERVIQKIYGAGVVSDADYDDDGKAKKFTVTFDSGQEKSFLFPDSFVSGMRLENGDEVIVYEIT